MNSTRRSGTLVLSLVLLLLLAACAGKQPRIEPVAPVAPEAQAEQAEAAAPVGYFDPHNHLSGVLPWPAYANLPAYIKQLQGEGAGVSTADKLRFYTWLAEEWYPDNAAQYENWPFSSSLRFGLGARATLALYPPEEDMDPAVLDGALERIYTATPFTEFDSAYAFHKPANVWLDENYYDNDRAALNDDLCTAQVLELARTDIIDSEQSISFIGGWRFDDAGYSPKLHAVLCAARRPQELSETLAELEQPVPRVRSILMTHTHELGQNEAGNGFLTYEHTGQCHWEALPQGIRLSPEQMYYALLGGNKRGQSIIPPEERLAFYDALAGIDTAAPEMTCFSDTGMAYYQRLVDAVYQAAKVRREAGWEGKLLVHTHVGEGFSVYYAQQPPLQPWSFESVFAEVPALADNVIANSEVAHDNISMLLAAIAEIRATHPDLDRYVVIRLGHVTHADLQQAKEMARLRVEADVNLDSNLSTGAWGFADMPQRKNIAKRVAAAAADPATNFELNSLTDFLMPDAADADTVAGVLGTHPLKYLLMANVRVMLGTDGAGIEHSSMPREYALADSLIRYWKKHDQAFARAAGDVDVEIFRRNADWHLANMVSNEAPEY